MIVIKGFSADSEIRQRLITKGYINLALMGSIISLPDMTMKNLTDQILAEDLTDQVGIENITDQVGVKWL